MLQIFMRIEVQLLSNHPLGALLPRRGSYMAKAGRRSVPKMRYC